MIFIRSKPSISAAALVASVLALAACGQNGTAPQGGLAETGVSRPVLSGFRCTERSSGESGSRAAGETQTGVASTPQEAARLWYQDSMALVERWPSDEVVIESTSDSVATAHLVSSGEAVAVLQLDNVGDGFVIVGFEACAP